MVPSENNVPFLSLVIYTVKQLILIPFDKYLIKVVILGRYLHAGLSLLPQNQLTYKTTMETFKCQTVITTSFQTINSIHKFTLKMQQILGSHQLKDHGPF